IQAINDQEKCSALVKHLQADGWKKPLLTNDAALLTEQLAQPIINTQDITLESRKTTAEAADVSLELEGDVNQELLDSLLNELPILTANFSSVIQKIIAGNNIQDLQEAQRIAHTLKGAGNIVGISGIATLTHHLEEILEQLTEQELHPNKALTNTLMEAADCLEMMSDALLGEGPAPEQTIDVLQQVLDWANQITLHGMPEEDADLPSHSTIAIKPETQTDQTTQPAKSNDAIAMTRVPSLLVDKLLRITGESSVLGEQFKERTERFNDELKALKDLTWQMQTLVSELDQFVNIQSYTGQNNRSGNDSEFDALEMDQYNELHTSTSRIAEVATDIREINAGMERQLVEVKELIVEQDNIQKENQEMVQSIRMIPAQTISSRCQRIVRQAARMTDKQVNLEIWGEDILIDSEILNNLVDPLMHLLRNAVDHGIESAENRQKADKNVNGNIQLEYSKKGNYAVVKCTDDGAGLNSEKILQTAVKKGLIPEGKPMSDAEINQLILIPGFSTRETATQVSGRGIGMDAIHTQITAMQGVMTLVSEQEKGLEVTLTIPLTLSSMQSLLVQSGGQTLAVSSRGLQQIYHSESGSLIKQNDEWFYRLEDMEIDQDELYPAKFFSELIGMSNENLPDKKRSALRIEDVSGNTKIVIVDQVLGYKDLLVKNMGHYIPNIPGVLGAAILGTGQVTPVVDLPELLHSTVKHQYSLTNAAMGLVDDINGLPVALVVDDSLSARRSVTQLLKDSGFETETAIDGLDAIKHIEKTIPDILIVDLEMPRMNGIELTAHIRSRTDLKNTPVIMITSRATEKHRKQAQAAGVSLFMTKPFSEDELINNIRAAIEN
ncbi:MAG: response regulator, partial [Thiotrichaceae bacterium]|nr:response regulator [Thiotrichaceae bacterium]